MYKFSILFTVFFSWKPTFMKTNNKLVFCLKIFIYLIFILSLGSCKKDKKSQETTINPNIELVIGEINDGGINSPCMIWNSSNVIYTVYPFGSCHLTSELKPQTYSLLEYNGNRFVENSPDEKKLLMIKASSSTLSFGSLFEYNIETNEKTVILDSSYNVSSAKYYRDNHQIIYYSYGCPIGTNPGYYLYSLVSRNKQLLLSYFPPAGISEYLNGFDIHPSDPILIIPIVSLNKTPRIIEYNFESGTIDTLKVNFDLSFQRICLWLRYNRAGDRILYSNFPRHAGGDAPNDDSEVGIIDRKTLLKKILDVNPVKDGRSISLCPHWSPDERNIIYSNAKLIGEDGGKGLYYIYILRNIDLQ